MTRRSCIAIAFVAVNLMACCCGGLPQVPVQPQQPAAKTECNRPVANAKVASRENYSKLYVGMTLEEAQDICGPGREDLRTDDTIIVSWTNDGCVISAVFTNLGTLQSKSIIGD